MPNQTEIKRRNKALIAFRLLINIRDGALISIRFKYVNLINGSIFQDAHGISTEFSKTFTTYLFPVDDDIHQIVINYLKEQKLWCNDDPLFPIANIGLNQNKQFNTIRLKRKHWITTGPIRDIFQQACKNTELPYIDSHSFRNKLVKLSEVICKTPEDFKVWSQNLGHKKVMITFFSYGQVAEHQQSKIITQLAVT